MREIAPSSFLADDASTSLKRPGSARLRSRSTQAAADVVSERSGIAMTNVVMESDNIEALPHTTPTAVLELI